MSTRLLKRPAEKRQYVFDFSLLPEIVAGDALSGSPVAPVVTFQTATPPPTTVGGTDLTLGVPAVLAGNKTVGVTMSNGYDGAGYALNCQCNTAAGSTLICIGRLDVSLYE